MDGPILVIDRDGGLPIGAQLVDGLRRGILGGALRAGDQMPSTRGLASELGVSRSAVVGAYEQLAGEGYLEMRQGAPTRVADLAPHDAAASVGTAVTSGGRTQEGRPDARRESNAAERVTRPEGDRVAPRIDLLPRRPSTSRIDTRAWRSTWREAAARDIPSESPRPFGVPRLREEIADHLRMARGVACEADDIVVTAGTSEALSLSASALAVALGRPPVIAVEHPGYPSARRTLELHGAATVPVAVDADGIVVEALRRMPRPPDAVMVLSLIHI